jgi:spermidine/putrescine transport system ATP-binding protein
MGVLSLNNVNKYFQDLHAVKDVSFEVADGEFVSLLGPSGCGKTTTLRMLAGLERPSEGDIRLAGERINELHTWERDTPLVWQNLALFPFLSVIDNVEFGLRMRGVEKAERERRAQRWLERLDIGEFADRNIAQLSGGQKQRVALARSLVTEPPILLLDEPLSALDANLKIRMQSVLTNLQKEVGITFVYVTHSHSEAFAMADRVVIMSNGKIEQIGTPETIYNHPHNRFVAEFIGGKNIIAGHLSGDGSGDTITVRSDHGTFTVPQPQDGTLHAGAEAPVVICVGADRLELCEAGTEGHLDCRIVSEEFVGSMITVHLETFTGLELQVQRPFTDWDAKRIHEGEHVGVTWPPEAALLLEAG